MKILWLAWKDYKHPEHGGAEIVLRELIARQLADGHQVTLLTAAYPGAPAYEQRDWLTVIRIGSNRYLHPLLALGYYLRHLRGRFDVVIETVNTAPYFSLLFRGRARAFAFYHQLAREVWFSETKTPLNYLGYYLIEPIATWLLARAKTPLITVSESTKYDLARYGWSPDRARIISQGIELTPIVSLDNVAKYEQPTMLSLGALRGMKRTLDQIVAFEHAKLVIPNLQLKIAGGISDAYGQQVLDAIAASPYSDDIEYLGRVSQDRKLELMQRSHIIAVTSIKEGWGLIVTEAASQGTPAVVYDVDGLRDSVKHGVTGLVTAQRPAALAQAVVRLLTSPSLYQTLQYNAWSWSRQFTFARSYNDFKNITEAIA